MGKGDLNDIARDTGAAPDPFAGGVSMPATADDGEPSGGAVQLSAIAKEVAECHVRVVLAEVLERGKPVPVAPLPGGWGPRASTAAPYSDELLPPCMGDTAGWPQLRNILGNWWADTLVVLVGHTGRGKSSFAIQIAEQAACTGAPVLYASMEMGYDELIARLLALRGRPGVSWSALKRGAYPVEAVKAAGDRLIADAPHLYLWAPSAKQRTPGRLASIARVNHQPTPYTVGALGR